MRHDYGVYVGNIGTVYTGKDYPEALSTYRHYVGLSEAEIGRAAGESVVLFKDMHPELEHIGKHEREGAA